MKRENLATLIRFKAKPVWKIAFITFLAIIVNACSGGSVSDLEEHIQSSRSKHKGTIEPLPAITPYESYRYHAGKERDPFKPSVSLVKSISINTGNGVRPNDKRNREDLERFALESLSMVGVMNNQGLTWGIIKAPDNAIYRVRKGNYLGLNHGRILSIKENKIDVREIVTDGMGGWIERPNTISLSE